MTSSSLPEEVLESPASATASAQPPALSIETKENGPEAGVDDSFWVYRPRSGAASPARAPGQDSSPRSAPLGAPPAETGGEAGLSLREAAGLVGASKSTILRAIQSGRLAAPKTEDGSYAIHAADLFSVFPPKTAASIVEPAAGDALPSAQAERAKGADGGARVLAARMAALEAEIKNLKTLLAEARRPTQPSWWRRMVG